MNEIPSAASGPMLNVYFIDDSATMREVAKIAFRRESFNVVTCADAVSAIAQFEQTRPHVIISDVIMPDRNGYQLCEYVKQHPEFGNTPVILLSGVVNRDVADKAYAVHADELMRKPFHPQELVGCVKKLLRMSVPEQMTPSDDAASVTPTAPEANPLTQLFKVPARTTGEIQSPAPSELRTPFPGSRNREPINSKERAVAPPSGELVKLRAELARLEVLVKKLQSQLDTEREYSAALESQMKNLSLAD